MRPAASRTLLALAVAALAVCPAAFAEKKNPPARPAAGEQQPQNPKPPRGNAPPGAKGPDATKGGAGRPAPNPFTPIDRWNAMNPKQRERMLERMDPDRRKQFLDKVERFNALPKEEQQMNRERYERLSKLPPDQQQIVRRDMTRLDKLPPARRGAMYQEFQKLRKMSEGERSTYLSSAEFRDRFYPAEQQMITNLTKVLPVRK